MAAKKIRKCAFCGADATSAWVLKQKYCSVKCRKDDYRRRVQSGKTLAPNATNIQVGTLAETIAVLDLLARGYMVYRPIDYHYPVDIIIMDNDGNTNRVEVKSGRIVDNHLYYAHPRNNMYDIIAVVIDINDIRYIPSSALREKVYRLA